MKTFESFDALDDAARNAVINLLYRLADDELIIGHRHSQWTGLAPILEEDIALSSMAQDEMGHAHVYYQMLHQLGEADPDKLAFTRKVREFRCASITSLPAKRDWALCIVRQFLYDSAESVRLAALEQSTLTPLAQFARKLRGEEKYHLMHGRSWILRLGNSTPQSHEKMQEALCKVYPHAMGLFEPTEADETLAQLGICLREKELCKQWESAAAPVLVDAGLEVPENVRPIHGGRVGRHSEDLAELLDGLQLVYSIDPSANW